MGLTKNLTKPMMWFRRIWNFFFAFKILIVDQPQEGAQAIRVFGRNKTVKFKNHFTGEYYFLVANDSYIIQSFLNCFMGILQTARTNHAECPGRKEGKCDLFQISSCLLDSFVEFDKAYGEKYMIQKSANIPQENEKRTEEGSAQTPT